MSRGKLPSNDGATRTNEAHELRLHSPSPQPSPASGRGGKTSRALVQRRCCAAGRSSHLSPQLTCGGCLNGAHAVRKVSSAAPTPLLWLLSFGTTNESDCAAGAHSPAPGSKGKAGASYEATTARQEKSKAHEQRPHSPSPLPSPASGRGSKTSRALVRRRCCAGKRSSSHGYPVTSAAQSHPSPCC